MLDAWQMYSAGPQGESQEHSHLLARVDKYHLAIPLISIISLHEAPLVFDVPCAQPGIAGAIQFGGIAIPVFDLRRGLRLSAKPVTLTDKLILVDSGTRIMALIVDEVKESVALRFSAVQEPSSLFGDSPINTKIISGIACAPQLCAVLDPAGLVQPDEWSSAAVRDAFEQTIDESNPLWNRTAALAAIRRAPEASGVEAAVFQIADQRFAVPLPAVLEFFTGAPHSPVPLRSNAAISLLNRRGEPVLLFDPRPALGLPAARLSTQVDGVVVSGDAGKMALPVDKLEGVSTLAPAEAAKRPGHFCLSVHPSEQGAVLFLDVPALLQEAQSALRGRSPVANAVA